eukprot:15450626-Alexandrium_andersonii.AAC.1
MSLRLKRLSLSLSRRLEAVSRSVGGTPVTPRSAGEEKGERDAPHGSSQQPWHCLRAQPDSTHTNYTQRQLIG